MWMPNLKMWNKKGFTLIELIVVMAILSILATISTFSYRGYNERARKQVDLKQMSSFVVLSEVFKATNQFFLPNMKSMNIPLDGYYNSTYKILCHKEGLSGDVLFSSDDSATPSSDEVCGWVELKVTSGVSKELNVGDQCKSSAPAKGWAGYIFCHYYAQGNPSEWSSGGWLPPADRVFPSSNNNADFGKGYDNLGHPYNQSGFQLEPHNSSDWENIVGDNDKKNDAFYQYFKIKDVSSECPRFKKGDYSGSDSCFMSKEFSVASDKVKTLLEALPNWNAEKDHFLSSPNRLVFVSLACRQGGFQECGDGGVREYRVISLDTNKIAKEEYGEVSF